MLSLLPQFCIGAPTATDGQDTATQYLAAWSFKDYPTMYRLSSAEVRKALPEQAFYSAAAGIAAPTGEPKIVNRSNISGTGETLYVQYPVSGSELPGRTSIVLQPDGIKHPELLSHAGPVQRGAASGIGLVPLNATVVAPTADKSIDGETAESILTKMQKATDAAETLKADLALRGSLMGETINETAKLTYRAPGHLRMQGTRFVMNSDGTKTILFLPQVNAYLDIGGLGSFELAPGIGTPVSELKEKYNISLAGKSEIEGVPAYQLNMKPPSSGSMGLGALMGGLGGGTMKLWVSAANWMPLRAKIDTISVDYKNMQINAGGIEDSTFVFVPPTGAQELNLGGLLGGLGGAALPAE
ncbi:MAG: LolA family protein [Candidatus Sumerlaeaceae bacterium]